MGDISIKGRGLLGGKAAGKEKKKHVFDSSAARKKDLKQQAYRAEVEKLGGKVTFAGEWKKGGKV